MSYTSIILSFAFSAFGICMGCVRGRCVAQSSCELQYLYDRYIFDIRAKIEENKSTLSEYPEERKMYSQAMSPIFRYYQDLSNSNKLFTMDLSDSDLCPHMHDPHRNKPTRIIKYVLKTVLLNFVYSAVPFLILYISGIFSKMSDCIYLPLTASLSFAISDIICAIIYDKENPYYTIKSVLEETTEIEVPDPEEKYTREVNTFSDFMKTYNVAETVDFNKWADKLEIEMTNISHTLSIVSERCRIIYKKTETLTACYFIAVFLITFATAILRTFIL